jgi:hypothetical protein
MPDTTPTVAPTEPVPGTVVVPPAEPPKKGPSLPWLILLFGVVAAGAGGYFLYAQLQKPVEPSSIMAPSLPTQERRPDQGFASQPAVTTTPSTTPTITASDSVSDIEKDLSGTTIESENTSEFDAELQGL